MTTIQFESMSLDELRILASRVRSLVKMRKAIINTNSKAEVFDIDMSFSLQEDEINELLSKYELSERGEE